MKKILSVFIAVLVLLSCLSLTAAADTMIVPGGDDTISISDPLASVTISDDYKTLSCGKYTYSRFSGNNLDFDIYFEIDNELILSDAQEKEIDNVDLSSDEDGIMIYADIYFNDGASLFVCFLRDDYIDEYNALNYEDTEKMYVYFGVQNSGDDIITETTKDLLKSEKTTISVPEAWSCDWFNVYIKSEKVDLRKQVGMLFLCDDEYYFVDYIEFEIDPADCDPMLYEGDAYKITDPALIQELEENYNLYYAEDYGFFFNDDFTQTVSKIFITLVFAIIPFAIFVLTLIFTIRSKNKYKKFHLTACILSAAELITLAIVLIII